MGRCNLRIQIINFPTLPINRDKLFSKHGYAYILNISSLRDFRGKGNICFYKYIAPLGLIKQKKSRSDDIFIEKHKRILKAPLGAKYKELRDVYIALLLQEGIEKPFKII